MKKKLNLGSILVTLLTFNVVAVDYPGTSTDCTNADSLATCVNAQPDGGSVTVVKNGLILSLDTIVINKEFSLQAGVGYRPILRGATINITVPINKKITFAGFELEQASIINASVDNGSELNILANNWSSPSTVDDEDEGIKVNSNLTSGNEAVVNIARNNLLGANNGDALGLLDIAHFGSGNLTINIHDNHIKVLDLNPVDAEAVYLFHGSLGNMSIQFVANEVRGAASQFRIRQINASASMDLGIVSNLFTGVIDANTSIASSAANSSILSGVTAGFFTGIIGNNTIDGVKRTGGADGTGLNFAHHRTSQASSLLLLNNIVVNTASGYTGPTTGTATNVTSQGDNLFLNHGTITGLTLVASDSNSSSVEFIQEGVNYALKSTSSAIDRASSSATALTYAAGFMQGMPKIDADGLRRYKGTNIDSGAYEWGDRHILHENTATSHISQTIADDDLNNNANALTIVTQIRNYNGSPDVYNDSPIGIYRLLEAWHIFNEDTVTMPNNAKFHVFYPYGDSSGADSFNGLNTWTAPSAVSGFELDTADLNNNPTASVFVTNLFAGSYNPHPLEVGYNNSNKWELRNADGVDMLANPLFLSYHQDGSRNVFHHYAVAANTSGNATFIDHPLLNGNPCALPTVTQSTSWLLEPLFAQNPHNIGVYYTGAGWAIFNQDFADINLDVGGAPVIGGRFNVMVNPQQVYECNEIIFKHGFE